MRKVLIWGLLISALVLVLLMAGPRLAGMQVCTVREPAVGNLRPGSLLWVREKDPQTLGTGDVITYMVSQQEVKTHRIAGVVTEEGKSEEIRFRTCRDDMAGEDPALVYYRNVLGVPFVAIPLLGYAVDWLATPAGWCAAGAVAALWLLLVLMPLFFRGKRRKKGGKYLK